MGNIICNPLNLPYRYQAIQQKDRRSLAREGADPTMLLYKGKYLLFVSMSGGFWYSDDMVEWTFRPTPELPNYHYAPDVHVVDDMVIFSASSLHKCRLYFSKDPIREPFQEMPLGFAWWDPALFQDDDGRVYFYWGCSTSPLMGIELDRKTLTPIGKKSKVIWGKPEVHGWERRGDNNIYKKPETHTEKMIEIFRGKGPFIEGAFMTKHDGKYYLQYAAPGTEHNVYGNGVYVSDKPLGPFAYQQHNPFSSVPGGFMTAAGHGSTFRDKNGKWWHIATMRISVNENFERRIGLFPCDFDEDGILHCRQELADYPFDAATGEKTGWMLLDATATASSWQQGFDPEKCCDENVRTWWAAGSGSPEEWLQLDLGEVKTVHAVQVNFADHKLVAPVLTKADSYKDYSGLRRTFYDDHPTPYLLEGSADGENWQILHQNHQDRSHDFQVFEDGQQLRYLRLSQMCHPMGGAIAVSGLRVFGYGNGNVPQRVESVRFRKRGELNIELQWDAAAGAARYNVRYGIHPEKLYSSWQVAENKLDLSFINAGEVYYAAVDAINENGITKGPVVRLAK